MNLNYFISETVFRFIVDAVLLVAEHGAKLLPCYRFSPDTGLWRHREWVPDADLSLEDAHFGPGGLEYRTHRLSVGEDAVNGYLDEALLIIHEAERRCGPPVGSDGIGAELEPLRWFPLPGEIGVISAESE